MKPAAFNVGAAISAEAPPANTARATARAEDVPLNPARTALFTFSFSFHVADYAIFKPFAQGEFFI